MTRPIRLCPSIVALVISLLGAGRCAAQPCPAAVDSPQGSVAFGSTACSLDSTLQARELEPENTGLLGIFTRDGAPLHRIGVLPPGARNVLKALAWSSDNTLAAMYHAGSGGFVVLISGRSGEILREIPIDRWSHSMRFSADGGKLIFDGPVERAVR